MSLDTAVTPKLYRAGLANDIMRFIQDQRRCQDLKITEYVDVYVVSEREEDVQSIEENRIRILNETFANKIETCLPNLAESFEHLFGSVVDGKGMAKQRVNRGWRKYDVKDISSNDEYEMKIFVDAIVHE